MAYTRLLRAYYHAERAIPEGQQYRLAKATTPAQRKAVDTVLAEFFVLTDGAYRQKRADAEIARYQDKQAKARSSANARWGGRDSQSERNANASPNAMRTHSEGNALQTPDTRHQERIQGADPLPPEQARAGIACRRMRTAGLPDTNPGHPTLLALIAAGITDDELAAAAQAAVDKGKGFAYALAVAEGRRRDAAAVQPLPDAPPSPEEQARAAAENEAARTAAYLAEQEAQRAASRSPESQEARRAMLAKVRGFSVVTPETPRTA